MPSLSLLLSLLTRWASAAPVDPQEASLEGQRLLARGEVTGCPSDTFQLAFEHVGLDEARLWVERTVTSRQPCAVAVPWSLDLTLPVELHDRPRLLLIAPTGSPVVLRGPAPAPAPAPATGDEAPAPAPTEPTEPPRRKKGR